MAHNIDFTDFSRFLIKIPGVAQIQQIEEFCLMCHLHTHTSSIKHVKLHHMKLDHLRNIFQDGLKSGCNPLVKHQSVLDSGGPIAEHHQPLWCAQHGPLLLMDLLPRERPGLVNRPTARADRPGVVPRRELSSHQREVDGLDFTHVGADVGLPILQLFQGVNCMHPVRSGDVPHPERQGNLFGETVEQGVERLEGAVVDDDAQAAELRIPAFVEADPFR